jgi:hypothetical protein
LRDFTNDFLIFKVQQHWWVNTKIYSL